MVRIVVSTMGHWNEWTLPMIASLYRHEGAPGERYSLVVVDGSQDKADTNDGYITHYWKGCSLSQAINWGANNPNNKWDWLLWLADDNLVEAPFINSMHVLDPLTVWHRKLVTNDSLVWGDGGQMLIHRALWDKVGQLDDTLQGGSEFMDLDYTMRAQIVHGHFGRMNLPVRNLPITIRLLTEAGREAREYNKKVMSEKWNTDLSHMHG
jgi:hypothetical protein